MPASSRSSRTKRARRTAAPRSASTAGRATVAVPPPAAAQPGWTNPLKAKLLAGERVVGAVITVNNPEVAAQIASFGFDFLWIDMEHTAVTLEGLRNMVLATRGLPAIPLARPPINELWTAKRVLDLGVLGVIFPFTHDAQLARQAVAACRYPPHGRRGSGAPLAAFRWPEAGNYYDFADANVLVIAIIEDRLGLENVEEIVATPGIDVIYVGTSDLALSLGFREHNGGPEVEAAVARIVAAAKAQGKILGCPGLTPAQIERRTAQGFQFFMTLTDWELMAAGAKQLLEPLRRA